VWTEGFRTSHSQRLLVVDSYAFSRDPLRTAGGLARLAKERSARDASRPVDCAPPGSAIDRGMNAPLSIARISRPLNPDCPGGRRRQFRPRARRPRQGDAAGADLVGFSELFICRA